MNSPGAGWDPVAASYLDGSEISPFVKAKNFFISWLTATFSRNMHGGISMFNTDWILWWMFQ